MPAAGIVTLIGVALTVAALAGYLLHVIVLLRGTHFDLGTIVAGLRAIAHQTEPLGEVLTDITGDLVDVEQVFEDLLVDKLGASALADLRAPRT